jgi:RNA polymerase sigma factor (sigma-70 family)
VRTDGEILAEFARTKSEAAFAEIVERHGGLVYAACRRVLGGAALADDAFQATFMILGKKAGKLSRRSSVAGWLAITAVNVARRTATSEGRRRAREEEASRMRAASREDGPQPTTALGDLDAALARLPERQREAVLLHHLEGRTLSEVATLTGVSERAAKWRAADGLERLRKRLAGVGSGTALGATALGSLLAAEGQFAPPVALAASLPAAVAGFVGTGTAAGIGANAGLVAQGVLKAMFWTKVKVVAAVVLTACAAGLAVPPAAELVGAAEPVRQGASSKVIRCRVTKLLPGGEVVISAGSKQGVGEKFEFDVTRDGKKIGVVIAAKVKLAETTATVKQVRGEIKVGDLAATRFKVVDPAAGAKAAGGPVAAPVAPKPLPKGIRQLVQMKAGWTRILAPSPSGDRLAILQTSFHKGATRTLQAVLVNTATGKITELRKFTGRVSTFARYRLKLIWSPDGSKLLLGNALDYNLKITVFDKDGKQLASYPAGRVSKEKFGRSFELLPSPDSRLLALYGGSSVSFRTWEGALKGSAKLGGISVRSAAWTPDSRKLRVMLYEQVKHSKTGKLLGQYRVNAVRTVTVDGGKVEQVKGTRRKEDKAYAYALSSDGLHALLSTGGNDFKDYFKGKFKYRLLNMSTGGSVDFEAAKLGFVPGKMVTHLFHSTPGVDGFVIRGADGVLRFLSTAGKLTEIARGANLQTTRLNGFGTNYSCFLAGEHVAFTLGTDLWVARLGAAGSARVVAKGWLAKKIHKARPAKGRAKARAASVRYWGRSMYDQLAFSGDGRRLFGALNIPTHKGTRIVEIPLGK